MSNDNPRIPEFAYYYGGGSIWDEELTGWIKSLLLFFDGIALTPSSYGTDRQIDGSVLAQPLAELGLLRNYESDLLRNAPIPASSTYWTRSGPLAQFLRRFEDGGLEYDEFLLPNAALIRAVNQKCGGDLEANLQALWGRNSADLLWGGYGRRD